MIADNLDCRAISSSAASPQRGSCRKTAQGKCSFLWMIEASDFCGNHQLHAMGFRQNAITIFRWCIIAPLSPSRVFALVRFLRFSPALNQQIQLLLNRFALEDEGQQLHHILIGQDGRLFQKGLQHSGTSAKPMGSLASGQPFQLALQSFLLVLGCGQLALRNILPVSQLFQFFAHGQLLLSDNGQNKSDQLFTVDRLWLGH